MTLRTERQGRFLASCGAVNMQTIDPKLFRSVMGAFPTGVAIVATEWDGELFGATINSLTSVSIGRHSLEQPWTSGDRAAQESGLLR